MWLAVRDGAHLSDGWAQKSAHSGVDAKRGDRFLQAVFTN
jgi:hypothetical protein